MRNSDRMSWPLAYALMIGAIATIVRAWGGRRSGLLLLALLLLQWVDLRPGIAARGTVIVGASRAPPETLANPFWSQAARTYNRIRAVPAANMGAGWDAIGGLAARMALPTDCIYLARVDDAALAMLRTKTQAILASGAYEPSTLYVLRDAHSLALAQTSYEPSRDLIVEADGYWVLAPGWHQRHPQ